MSILAEGRVHSSFAEIPQAIAHHLLDEFFDNLGYYRAVEAAPPPGFKLGAISAGAPTRPIAVAPLFAVDYRLDTSLQGGLRRLTDRLHKQWPRVLSLPLLAMGPALLNKFTVGFANQLSADERQEAFSVMLIALEREAERRNSALLIVRSIDDEQAALLDSPLRAQGYRRITCLPNVVIDLSDLASFDQYLMTLSKKRRANFRQKLRALEQVHIDFPDSVAGLEDELATLFDNTRTNSAQRYDAFDMLHPEYFGAQKKYMGERMQFALAWDGPQLLGFLSLLVAPTAMMAPDFGTRYPRGRELNVYFLCFMKAVQFAIEHGVKLFDMGGTTYGTKLQFGGRLSRRWIYLKFRNGHVNRLLGPLVHAFDFERNDPELRRLQLAVHR